MALEEEAFGEGADGCDEDDGTDSSRPVILK